MSVLVKFIQSGMFHAGEFKFQISRQRNSCELLATTPENPRPDTPYMIARRDNEYQLQDILKDLQQLQQEHKDIIYDITDTGVSPVNKI